MPVIGVLKLSGEKGKVYYDGPVYKGEKKIGILSKEIKFIASWDSYQLELTNVGVNTPRKSDITQEVAEKIMPDFFVLPKSRIVFKVTKEKNGFFFFKDNVPMFYCNKTK
ncbi:hypothetical protein MXF09_23485 [Klebsiella aerogenes]|uniref:hypothetical protein n=1 Tax=Klebsiella aerogenes TaxID=548 RepID=UPI002DB6C3D7|nr:hypothetical protein [Klebsiella aerogenes]MEB5742659.1 hypothetical protein [Klebsiella aerogenes]